MGLLYNNNHRNIKLNLAPPLPVTIKPTHKCINNLMMKYIYIITHAYFSAEQSLLYILLILMYIYLNVELLLVKK